MLPFPQNTSNGTIFCPTLTSLGLSFLICKMKEIPYSLNSLWLIKLQFLICPFATGVNSYVCYKLQHS